MRSVNTNFHIDVGIFTPALLISMSRRVSSDANLVAAALTEARSIMSSCKTRRSRFLAGADSFICWMAEPIRSAERLAM
jgi:hypothetical protein